MSRYGCWLAVLAEAPGKPLRIGRGMGVDPARLEAIAAIIDRWRG